MGTDIEIGRAHIYVPGGVFVGDSFIHESVCVCVNIHTSANQNMATCMKTACISYVHQAVSRNRNVRRSDVVRRDKSFVCCMCS